MSVKLPTLYLHINTLNSIWNMIRWRGFFFLCILHDGDDDGDDGDDRDSLTSNSWLLLNSNSTIFHINQWLPAILFFPTFFSFSFSLTVSFHILALVYGVMCLPGVRRIRERYAFDLLLFVLLKSVELFD